MKKALLLKMSLLSAEGPKGKPVPNHYFGIGFFQQVHKNLSIRQ
ncbi:MAG: hypothetical protein CM1200mP28_08490 [Deltaproteobacteria bacterium]|nr:MAG: hypothetical protein CM1200mP28_08490 [Deltaproteobacteria bacterium]